ncbi:hypothetical protein FDP41_012790 [Naegleria fowleri]|uniref:DUF4116 domain-containing protein n=1 Tax=Naegleria fowleri TaxID=5763 RepID=A0A6A5C2M0_NAEFO|nr:uncharacterized protein FDP41_012790 [Naegleria fowleri]KAF0981002.1 hypothetical protein FDP41_012790 [Naegleria fowleri]
MKRKQEEEINSVSIHTLEHSPSRKLVKLSSSSVNHASEKRRTMDDENTSCTKILLHNFSNNNIPIDETNNERLKELQMKLKMKFQNQMKGFSKWFLAKEAFKNDISRCLHPLKWIPIEFLDCQEVVLCILENISSLIEFEYYPKNYFPSWILECVAECEMESQWKHCKAVIMRAIAFNVVNVFNFATKSMLMQFKHDLIYYLLQSKIMDLLKQNGSALLWARAYQNNYEIVLTAVQTDSDALKYASASLQDNFDIVKKAVSTFGCSLAHASPSLKKNFEICLTAVKQDGFALLHVDPCFRNNIELVFNAVKQNGRALEIVSADLRNNFEIVLTAVRQNGASLAFAASEFQDNEEIVKEAVKTHGLAIHNASSRLRSDKNMALSALQQNGNPFEYIDEQLQNDQEIYARAVQNSGNLQSQTILHNIDRSSLNALKRARLEYMYHDFHIPYGYLVTTPVQLCKPEITLKSYYSDEMWWSYLCDNESPNWKYIFVDEEYSSSDSD